MTREEFFFKYGCDCKDKSCSSVVKSKCSAKFYHDLDSVIQEEQKELNMNLMEVLEDLRQAEAAAGRKSKGIYKRIIELIEGKVQQNDK